jgi:NAD(P)-dependent dehydrogenase (short-subunit alcohol dehydrogenase family)
LYKELFDLTARCTIVTGGAQGLGMHMATALAEMGSDIVIADKNIELAKKAAIKIKKLGVKTIAVKVDVTKKDEVQSMVDTVMKKFGKIDVLLNNAGIVKHIDADVMAYEDWLEVIDVNLNGIFLVAQAVGRVMIKQKKGSIINTSSVAGVIVPYPQSQTSYNASKAGVILLTKSLASEWAKHNIRVNTIAPGYMSVGVAKPYFAAKGEMVRKWLSMTPMNRPGEGEELGGIAIYLASDASSFVTGGVFILDGGLSIW